MHIFQLPAPLHTVLLVPAGASQEVILGFKSLYSSLVQLDRNLKVSFLKALLHPFTAASDLNTSGASRSDTRSAACSCCWSVAFRLMPGINLPGLAAHKLCALLLFGFANRATDRSAGMLCKSCTYGTVQLR